MPQSFRTVQNWADYMRLDFEQSPVQPLHLMLLMKDIHASAKHH